jgi:hypothetical protein
VSLPSPFLSTHHGGVDGHSVEGDIFGLHEAPERSLRQSLARYLSQC